jgi:hypothetical protein
LKLAHFVRQVTPLCSVPIQTTATLNIQLFPVPGGGQRSPDSAKNGMPSPRMTLSTTTSTNPKTTKTFAVNPDVSATSPTVNHSPRDDNHKHTEAVRKMSSGSTDQRSPTALTSSETMTDQLSVSDVSDHTQQANAAAAVAAASAAAASAAAAAAAAAASTMNVATTSVGVGEDNADDAFTAVVRTDSRSTGSATDSFTSTGDLTAPELHEAFAWTDGNTEEYDASGGMSTSATATCSVTTSDSSHDVASYNQLSSAAVGEKYNEYQGDSSESYRSEVADVTALPPAAESGSSVELDKPEASSFR